MRTFTINTRAGALSATLNSPASPHSTLLLAHGAGADHQHAHMQSLAEAFSAVGMATMRFNFPFKEAGKNGVDSIEVSTTVICDAAAELRRQYDLPLFAGGHSFGGRMVTHAVASGLLDCSGLILCSFPLHPAGKPGTQRAAHLGEVTVPMLCLNGTRDALADLSLLTCVMNSLDKHHQLHWLETADHSYKILKRSRPPEPGVYEEAAGVAEKFVTRLV